MAAASDLPSLCEVVVSRIVRMPFSQATATPFQTVTRWRRRCRRVLQSISRDGVCMTDRELVHMMHEGVRAIDSVDSGLSFSNHVAVTDGPMADICTGMMFVRMYMCWCVCVYGVCVCPRMRVCVYVCM